MMDFETQCQKWVRLHSFSDKWVVILGVGNGEHVQQYLQEKTDTKVTVIEFDPQKLPAAQSLLSQFPGRVDFRLIPNQNSLFQEIFENLPPILCFQPGYGSFRTEFETLFRFLTGRSREGLEYFLRMMGSHLTIEQLPQSDRLLTIKDLGFVIDIEKVDHPAASVVRILRELIV